MQGKMQCDQEVSITLEEEENRVVKERLPEQLPVVKKPCQLVVLFLVV